MDLVTLECRAFLLDTVRTSKLATVRADGRPHVVPIWFDLDSENRLYFNTWHTTMKAKNMRRDSRVCMSVDDEHPPFTFAMLEGTAEFIDDAKVSLYWATRFGGRYMGSDQAEAYGKRNSVEGELLVRVTLTRVLFQKDIAN
ncbi:MAG: PPOX class F420-dependent oxidoreductase [Ktedonobacteraceae bacterium]